MKNLFTSSIFMICLQMLCHAQTRNISIYQNTGEFDQIEIKADKFISLRSFNKLVFQDLNFLVLGDNTPSQGISFELAKEDSELTLSGLLDIKKTGILTLDAKFAVDNGVYFFDQNNGSKQSKVTLNYFIPWGAGRSYPFAQDDPNVARALMQNEIMKREHIISAFKKYRELEHLMNENDIPVDNKIVDKIKKELLNSKTFEYKIMHDTYDKTKISDADLIAKHKLKVEEKDPVKLKIKKTKDNANGVDIDREFYVQEATPNVKITKLITSYNKALKAIKHIQDSLSAKEIEVAKEHWTAKKIQFVGISPSYQRENVNVYKFEEDKEFAKLFNDARGDTFELTGSYNFFYQNTKEDCSIKMVYIRSLLGIGRGSNIKTFKNSTVSLTTQTGDTINGNPIEIVNTQASYTGAAQYEYGLQTSASAEVYIYPSKIFGFFGRFGYTNLNYKEKSTAKDSEKYNMRLGLLVNLKGKDKKKNILTVQLFFDRADLKNSPNSDDKDLRVGFKLGLPVFIKSQL